MHKVHNSGIIFSELFPFVTFSCLDNNSSSTYTIGIKLHICILGMYMRKGCRRVADQTLADDAEGLRKGWFPKACGAPRSHPESYLRSPNFKKKMLKVRCRRYFDPGSVPKASRRNAKGFPIIPKACRRYAEGGEFAMFAFGNVSGTLRGPSGDGALETILTFICNRFLGTIYLSFLRDAFCFIHTCIYVLSSLRDEVSITIVPLRDFNINMLSSCSDEFRTLIAS